jgi:hypothetical protein
MPDSDDDHADTNNDSGISVHVHATLTKTQVIEGLRWFVDLLETAPENVDAWDEWIAGRATEQSGVDGQRDRQLH